MTERNELGYFEPGHTVKSPGRPSRVIEGDYLRRMTDLLTPEKWDKIVNKAIADAIKGNGYARQWLSDYVIGKPVTTINLVASEQALLARLLEALQPHGLSASQLFQEMLDELSTAEINTHE